AGELGDGAGGAVQRHRGAGGRAYYLDNAVARGIDRQPLDRAVRAGGRPRAVQRGPRPRVGLAGTAALVVAAQGAGAALAADGQRPGDAVQGVGRVADVDLVVLGDGLPGTRTGFASRPSMAGEIFSPGAPRPSTSRTQVRPLRPFGNRSGGAVPFLRWRR